MRAGQLCTFRKNRVGWKYGELTVITDVGNRVYRYRNVKVTTPILELTCKIGHTEQRTVISLNATRDKTCCKECRRNKTYTNTYYTKKIQQCTTTY
jgi:hypothetical protein